jgi:PST family polysaccharide transporter
MVAEPNTVIARFGASIGSLRTVFGNTIWVAVWQAANQLPAVITLPFLARALGPETLGVYAQMLAIGAWVGLLVDFAFSLTATREVAGHREDERFLKQLFAQVLASKILLAAAAGLLVALASIFFPADRGHLGAFVFVFLTVVATAFTPAWLFLGLERVRPLAITTAFWKFGAVVLIIFLAHDPSDLLTICVINALATVVILLQCIWILRRTCWPLPVPTLSGIRQRLAEGAGLFVASTAVNTYTLSVVLIVSLLLGPAAAGIYSVADRVRQFALGLLGPITAALYPSICRAVLVGESSASARARSLLFRLMVATAALISAALFFAAPTIGRLVGGPGFEVAAVVIRVMSAIPVVVTLTNILSTQTMLPNGLRTEYLMVTLVGAVAGVLSVSLLTRMQGLIGAGWACLLTESFVMVVCAYVVAKRGLLRGIFFPNSARA